ncbi:MAG: WcaI family glycosyltransferase [Devosia sp.]
MRLLVVGLNYAPEKVGIAVYTTGLAEALQARGHEVRVVAGQPYYPAWRSMAGHRGWGWSCRTENGVRVLRVPHYIPARPTGARRLLHHASFAVSALLPALWWGLTFRPATVLAVAPSLLGAPVARLAAGVAGARSWLHVQDLEVDVATATGLLADGGRAARLARAFERAVLRSFRQVTAISPAMCRRLVEKGVPRDRVAELRNWADLDPARPPAGESPFRAEWGITTPHVALYAGNIANKQGMEVVLEAARRLQGRGDLTFVVCGDGPNRARLERQAAGFCNIRFHPLQPRERLAELLGLATVHLLPQVAGVADLVLPSKLTNMLASGRPVVATAARGSSLHAEVEGCGLLVEPGDGAGFAAAIGRLLDDPATAAALGAAGRRRAEERWARRAVIERAISLLKEGREVADAANGAEASP